MKRKILIGLLICFSLLTVSCSGGETSQVDAENTDENIINKNMMDEADEISDTGIERPIVRLAGSDTGLPNPFRHLTRGPGNSKMQLLYDSLLEIDSEGYIPWLASEWSVDESGLIYSFTLVENAFWHDYEPLSVEDVIFTFKYYEQHTPVVDDLHINGEFIVEEVKKTGENTFNIIVTGIDNTNLARLGGTRILPKHIWENIEEPLAYDGEDAAIGSGPFVMEHYDASKGEYRYAAFDKYWGPKPAVEAIEWVPVSDSVLAFENQEIDLVNVSSDLLERYKGDSQFTVRTLPSYHSYRLMMNMDRVEILQDVKLRQAIAYAIDRQALVDKIARGSGVVSSMGYVPENSKWYNSAINDYTYSVDKSKELLDGKTLSLKLLTGNTSAEVKIAELIKLDLEKVGVTAIIESVEAKTRDQAVKTGDYELLLINSGGMGGDPDYLRSIYGSFSPNSTALSAATIIGYYNEGLFRLGAEQAITLDESRKDILFEMQEIIADEVPMILLFSVNDNFVYRQDYYDGWYARFDHSKLDHNKLSYLLLE